MTRYGAMTLAAAVAVGCSGGSDDVGPFTGEVHRFVVDDVRMPVSRDDVALMGGDLTGDDYVDNQLGHVLVALRSVRFDAPSPHALDMIRSGVLASSVELQADDLVDDDTVGVRYLGAEGAGGELVGGRLRGSVFEPNRTAVTRRPGEAVIRLPFFLEADPIEVRLRGLELELVPDGAGGYLAALHGGIPASDIGPALHAGITQMIAANPGNHLVLERMLDVNRDGAIELAETEALPLLQSLAAPDIELPGDDERLLSFGFQVHLAPCAEGHCAAGTPADRCHDRVRNGDETDLDCGGTCALACAPGLACGRPEDCQSGGCAAGGCAAASCSDGIRDGFESDVDCGGPCAPCGAGETCAAPADCRAGLTCSSQYAIGTCVVPAT